MTEDSLYNIKEFDPQSASDDLWNQYFDLYEEIHLEDFPTYPLPIRELEKKKLITLNPYRDRKRWIVMNDNSEMIGYAYRGFYSKEAPEYETNGHLSTVHIAIKKNFRRKGIGTEIFHMLQKDVKTHGRTKMEFWFTNPVGAKACENWDAKLVHKHYVSRLDFRDINWDLMRKWILNSKTTAPEVKLEFFNDVPEVDIEQFVELYTETINQAPWGSDSQENLTIESRRYKEKDHKEKGDIWTTLVTREANGEISGLTEIIYNQKDPTFVQQELTGVRNRYRMRGLGKLLKAKMIHYIKETYPEAEYMTTGNAMKNEAILSINRRMGFKLTNEFFLYQVELN